MAFEPRFKTLVQVYEHAMASFGNNPLFGTKQAGTWRWMSYSEFGAKVDAMRGGLSRLGIGQDDRVAVIADNRPEWAIAAYATYGLGASFVPMYESQQPKDWHYILADCGAKVVFAANESIAAGLAEHRHDLPNLNTVVLMDGEASDTTAFAKLTAGESAPLVDVQPDDIAGYIYTSGTTGKPKGVLLSHANFASNVSAIHQVFPIANGDRSLSFLPWAHSFGQTCELHALFSMGASLGIAEAVDKIVANLAEVKPTLLFSVPRIFNRIYDGLHKRMAEEGGLKLKLFEAAVATAEHRKRLASQRRRSGWTDFKFTMLDGLVFSKVRERFGGRLKYAFSGGAALSKEVAEFVDNLGILVYEGYGLTETSPIATANNPSARRIGSVGKPIPGVRIHIDNEATDDPKHGEIVIIGHNVMQGYYGLEEENKRVFVDIDGERGFRSGDMGFVDENGFLFITGRIKEQYKLLNGKYVVPTPLEERIKLSRFVANVMIHGANEAFNVALVVPDFETLVPWAKQKGLGSDTSALVKNATVRTLIQDEIDRYGADFKGYEKPRKIALIEDDFTTENGLLTPKMSLKRRKVLERYSDTLAALYKS